MVLTSKDPVLTVLSLSGGNDGLNTVIPRNDGLYWDYRPTLAVPEDQIIPINDELGFHPTMAPLKKFWDEGKMAIFVGIGYPTPSYSHFRSMDIWHTCEPEKIETEGWLGRATKQLDPNGENVLTAVNFGRGLPRALVMDGVPVASVGDLETYGLLKGADILSTAPEKYSSNVEYSPSSIGQYMKNIAQTHLAGFGTRVLYTTSPYNGFDSHANQAQANAGLWTDVSNTVDTFFTDLREHNASDNVTLLLFTEFGRRIKDNGACTDHGAAGVAMVVGEHVKGGIYGTYPSLEPSQQEEGGNLKFNLDYRSMYSTILEDWFGLAPEPIVGGNFERVKFFN